MRTRQQVEGEHAAIAYRLGLRIYTRELLDEEIASLIARMKEVNREAETLPKESPDGERPQEG